MSEGMTCYERDEEFCEDQMCLRVGCRIHNERPTADKGDLDLVGRLRDSRYGAMPSQRAEAADEIERLRERCLAYKGQVKAGSDEIESLKASLASARKAAIEECAKVAGAHANGWAAAFDGGAHEQIASDMQEQCEVIAEQIRALSLMTHSQSSPDIWDAVAANVKEQLAEGDGCWTTCSGCHESEDGYDNGYYPHSDVFGCKLGGGCSECGGIGAIWDTTDYAAMGEELTRASLQPATPAGGEIQLQARKAPAGEWINIHPTQLEWCAKMAYDVRAIEAARCSAGREPVGWRYVWPDGAVSWYSTLPKNVRAEPVYASPQHARLSAGSGESLKEANEHLSFLVNLPGVHPHRIAKIREALNAPAQATPQRRYRHKVRGTTYRVLYEAAKASSIVAALDDMTMVVYQGEADGLIWVRPAIEFFDGRFEALSISSTHSNTEAD